MHRLEVYRRVNGPRRCFALAAVLLLTTFAVTMVMALGVRPPLDDWVLSAASAAYLLFAVTETSTKLQSDRDEN